MSNYIYEEMNRIISRFHTRDPFEILSEMHVIVSESDRFSALKGFCFLSCRTVYVVINSKLADEEKRIVAAHELGHIVLHRDQLKMAPMKDSHLYDMASRTEYEANLFAADLLLSDSDVETAACQEDLDYFGLCSLLSVNPDFMSFKLFSLLKRGRNIQMPLDINSTFLKQQLSS